MEAIAAIHWSVWAVAYVCIGLVLATAVSKQQIKKGNTTWGWGPSIMIVIFWITFILALPVLFNKRKG